MPYTIKIQKFEGPLDLLLQLIEKEELDITEISLAHITEQYLEYLAAIEQLYPDELADFLVVATKLLLIKSHMLLPELAIEDEDEESLTRQLQLYKKYMGAAHQLHDHWKSAAQLYVRPWPKQMLIEREFLPPKGFKTSDMVEILQNILSRLAPVIALPKTRLEKAVSLQEKIAHIQEIITEQARLTFHQLLHSAGSRTEIIITFLALLELVKQKAIVVQQERAFGDITLKKTNFSS